jgi:hypothetical protein
MSARRDQSGAARGNRTRPYQLGRLEQSPNYKRRKWCRPEESNLDPAFFKRVREPSLLDRRNGCGGRSRTDATKLMRLGGNRSSPQFGCRCRIRTDPSQAVRPLSRAYKAHPLTRANDRKWSGQGDSNPSSQRWQRRALPLSYARKMVDRLRIELSAAILQGSPAPRCPARKLDEREETVVSSLDVTA